MAVRKYVDITDDVEPDYQAYGGSWDMWSCLDHEILLHGPADTGKTRSCLEKVHAFMQAFPGARAVCVRRFRSDLRDSSVYVLMQIVLGGDHEEFGMWTVGQRENPDSVRYPNGSSIWFRGLDDEQKALGAAYDIGFASQCEELTEKQWDYLVSRVSGRAKNTPYPQVLADANPSGPDHWLLSRRSIKRFASTHRDNPDLYTLPGTNNGVLTEMGKTRIGVLHNLTGVTKDRLLWGKWVAAEGVIYDEFLVDTHVVPPVEAGGERYLSIDFGYENPTVVQWWKIDGGGRMILAREIYETRQIVEDIARRIKAITKENEEVILGITCDRDAEGVATLERHLSVETTPAQKGKGSIRGGIDLVKTRLAKSRDGRPRILFAENALVREDPNLRADRRPTSTRSEFATYMWRLGSRESITDEPNKKDDHGMDAMRYFVLQMDSAVARPVHVRYRSRYRISDF